VIAGIDSGTSNSSIASTTDSQTLGQVEFINLLIAQLQHQDPLQPTEGSEFIAQLAQFSQLDETRKVSAGMSNVENYMASLNNFSSLALLGQNAEFNGNGIAHVQGTNTDLRYQLPANAESVTVTILDAQGVPVCQKPGPTAEGIQTVVWDGRDGQGGELPSGTYRFSVAAKDAAGNEMKVETMQKGTVEKVEFREGMPYLLVNGRWLSLDDVHAVGRM